MWNGSGIYFNNAGLMTRGSDNLPHLPHWGGTEKVGDSRQLEFVELEILHTWMLMFLGRDEIATTPKTTSCWLGLLTSST